MAETESLQEFDGTVRSLVRMIAESMSIPESSEVVRVLVKYVNESEDIGEAVNRLMEISTVINESGEITEFSKVPLALIRVVAETLGLPENIVGLVMSGDVTQGYTVRTTDVSHTVETEG